MALATEPQSLEHRPEVCWHQDVADALDVASNEGRTPHCVDLAFVKSQLSDWSLDAGPDTGIVGVHLGNQCHLVVPYANAPITTDPSIKNKTCGKQKRACRKGAVKLDSDLVYVAAQTFLRFSVIVVC